jgi:hypothetical protein
MKKFNKCSEFFKWICSELSLKGIMNYTPPESVKGYRVLAVDASDVMEKGCTKRTYHLHYAVDIFKMATADFSLTTGKTGESLKNFNFCKGDLVVADRAYGSITGIDHVKSFGADCILRLKSNSFTIYDESKKAIKLTDKISHIDSHECCEINAFYKSDNGFVPIRICAKKKDEESSEKALKTLKKQAKKRHTAQPKDETILLSQYIVVATTLPPRVSCEEVLNLYRYRWQVEICFKRMKSIIGFGQLPKKTEQSSLTWLNAKLMVSLLIETFIAQAAISP